ncbi:hypothetical protein B4073_3368 [Bacillus subtilis]|nr:hypothetical protein B4073_3368 [Bacillus subtilis]
MNLLISDSFTGLSVFDNNVAVFYNLYPQDNLRLSTLLFTIHP